MLNSTSRIWKLALLTICFFVGSIYAQPPNKDILGALRYRHVGPVGNRVTSVVGIPGQPNIYYVGAASGGIFKTTDGGVHWDPIFDGQPVSSIGSLAIAPSDPNIVWAGTGESCIRSHISVGQGIYKSTDAGRTWTLMGLEKTGRIGQIIIDPNNPDIVMACALGHAYGPQPERGVYRTKDGGKNWERVLFTDENCGCSDLAIDPKDPRTLFAGMWPLEIHTWGRESGGPGSGLFKSTDSGVTWKRITGHGLPAKTTGKVSVAIAPSNPKRIYALIETGDGVPVGGQETDRGKLWRSDDGGENWRLISYDRTLGGRTHYYFHVAVAPDNENETYYLTAGFSVSNDGGETLRAGGFGSSPGGDNHEIWIDPTNANRMAVANDGGVSISVTRGRTWDRIQLPIAQMYHVTVDNRIPYYVYGNKQDGPSYRGPSRTGGGGFGGGQIPRSAWQGVGGGESGWATPDPVDPNIIWSSASGSGSVGGIVERFDLRNGQGRNVEVWPDQTNGSPAGELKYRFIWTFPFTISPHDPKKLYVGSQYVHQTTDAGQSWQIISPDLTTNDKSKQGFSGGLTGDNIGVEYFSTLFAIAESPREKGLIWAGSNDGLVQLTRDGGKSWNNVTGNIPNLPKWGTISNIEASRYAPGTAYLTVDLHQVNNRDPFVYKTSDYGKTWTAITNGIPRSMLSYAHCVREDPVRQGLLYLGTENGLYVSFDDGGNWEPLQSNLPHAPVYWITIQEHFNDLVIATYGRGFWILDDLTPLQQLTNEVRASNAHLFTPRPVYRFRGTTVPYSQSDDPTAGQNPPYGAAISYYLKSAPTDATIVIEDAKGQTVRTLTGTKNVGMNRVTWDLRGESTAEVRMRTSPAYAPEIRLAANGYRPAPGAGRMSVLLPPGTYTVKLSVAESGASQPTQTLTQQLVVKKDPNSAGTEADIQTQVALLQNLRQDIESTANMLNQIEWIRSQLTKLSEPPAVAGGPSTSNSTESASNASSRQTQSVPPAIAGGSAANAHAASNSVLPVAPGSQVPAEVVRAAIALNQKLTELEEHLIQRKLTGQGQDTVRWPPKLITKLNYLANGIASADFPPTTQHREVHALFKTQVSTHRKTLDNLLTKDLEDFNQLLRDRGQQPITPAVPK